MAIISRFPDPNATPRELDVQAVYATLNRKERLYAHHMSRAAWNGSRIIMRQTSPEAIGIFDFIMELYHTLDGQWTKLIDQRYTTSRKLDAFLQYAALFLCNMGNYYGGSGGEKFIPELTSFDLIGIARVSTKATSLLDGIIVPMLSVQPTRIGYPGEDSQSNYYLGNEKMTLREIALVSEIMGQYNIDVKNIRLRKLIEEGQTIFEVLPASVEPNTVTLPFKINEDGAVIRIVWGDHAEELSQICTALAKAKKYAKKDQIKILSDCIESFRTGSMQAFCESQKSWAMDISQRWKASSVSSSRPEIHMAPNQNGKVSSA